MRRILVILPLISLLTACPGTPLPVSSGSNPNGTVNPQPTTRPTSSAQPTPSTSSGSAPTTEGPGVGATPGTTPSPGTTSLVLPASIRMAEFDRYFKTQGEARQLQISLLDELGQALSGDYPLEFTSSRPQDVSVSSTGLITALTDSGYSEVQVKLPGTGLGLTVLINVYRGFGGGSSGSSGAAPGSVNTAPVIQSLTANRISVTGGGVLVQLNASATDAQSALTDANYSWSCSPQPDCGSFTQANGRSPFWTSPTTAGAKQIILSVSDGSLSTQQSLTISVINGNGNLQIN